MQVTTRSRLAVLAAAALTLGCTTGAAAPHSSHTPASPSSALGGVAPSAAATGTAAAHSAHPIGYWPTYHGDNTRAGVDTTSPPLGKSAVAWRKDLDGAVYGSPLIVGSTVIAATENNTVYALRGGHVVWSRHLGTPVKLSSLPCGNIDPLGITSTPVYDQSSGILYAAAELAGPIRHTLFALNAVTGKVLWHKGLDVKGMDARAQQQRAALTLANGRVYVPLGGLAGDCSDYHGWVIGYTTTGKGPVVYKTKDTEAGIWAPSGPAVTPDGHLLTSVGNSGHTSAGQGVDQSDAVLSLSPTLHLDDYFAPTSWAADNAADLDLGSTGPAYLPGGKVFIAGKRGVAYLLDASHLGHVGGQRSSLDGCASYGGTAYYAGVVFAPCRDGVAAIKISGNRMSVLWKAPSNISGSPIYGGGAVWTLDQGAGVVYGLSRTTGKVLRKIDVGQTSRFATMAMLHGYLHVPTLRGVVVVRTG